MDSLETLAFARSLIDIDSTTGREAEAGQAVVIVGITVGTATIDMTRLVTVAGPTTLTLTGRAVDPALAARVEAALAAALAPAEAG